MKDLILAVPDQSSQRPAVGFANDYPAELTLPSNDPGLHDAEYVARRSYFFQLARRIRTRNLPFPEIEYYEYEHETWRIAWRGLHRAHLQWACLDYLQGVQLLAIDSDHVPKANELAAKLRAASGTDLIPAEGMVKTREFFGYLAQKKVPCSIFLRHASQPEYGTEPDLIHDATGHFPMLVKREYADFVHMIGRLAQRVSPDVLTAIERLYLYTVERRRLDIDDLITRGFNLHSFQDVYYVIPSFSALVDATHRFIRRLGYDPSQI